MRRRPGTTTQGLLSVDGRTLPCALGSGGLAVRKREGDGATPIGRFWLKAALFRADRVAPPAGDLPIRATRADDGWSDDPGSALYNLFVRLPQTLSHERLMRTDHLYDVVVITDHNRTPRVRRHGSAVFLHCSREGLTPTAGCVALPRETWRRLGAHLVRNRPIDIDAVARPVRRRRARPFFRRTRSAI
ncbi:L,D-peptidoglycan transpeptidase YkuD (ErfK/YbiS/YcfS/YnhG family) [Amorphus orientalis]|uniref:L,D-peptidoglycan transpeptidase YkuD (ErfK/YbiS/YcfS/YnhG family) n=1 Tax=Amorphus orientalis TaxID=649198 RepID=A0AAE3VK78_9HYPH|nr:L,D-peptidoglycan transpeptidase YkuD (ErfK/YbiS/YcfS/YnhG family) [Amorphus orientalis]